MEEKTVYEKKCNTFNNLNKAKEKVEYIQLDLKENKSRINDILILIKKTRKIIYYFNYIIKNWSGDSCIKTQRNIAEQRLPNYLRLYKEEVLKRKILKAQLKNAQREFSKKQKSIVRFNKKYYNK